ncbi:hypothetical protein HX13_16980 [Chryseobacterium sp. P1-3]|nr:hypothetical protein HX13_16980 [Chryseobacterium sp. P1-3]
MSNILFIFFKLTGPYLEPFKFTAFFPKGSTRLASDHYQLIEIFDSIWRRKLIKQSSKNKPCKADRPFAEWFSHF